MPQNPTGSPSETRPPLTAAISTPAPQGHAANWRSGFWSLMVTQFQGAFNDNALKFLVIYHRGARLSFRNSRPTCASGGRAVCASLYSVFARRRVSRRQVQQALGDDLHEDFRKRRNDF